MLTQLRFVRLNRFQLKDFSKSVFLTQMNKVVVKKKMKMFLKPPH